MNKGGSTTEENLWLIETLLNHIKHYRYILYIISLE